MIWLNAMGIAVLSGVVMRLAIYVTLELEGS